MHLHTCTAHLLGLLGGKSSEFCYRCACFCLAGSRSCRLFSLSATVGADFYATLPSIICVAADYHRFHSPVTGVIKSIVEIPGHLYTVNPIAVNSPMVNVLTENKRVRVHIETEQFGDVQFVAIGATAVGSIRFTVDQGSKVKKGDELGYFAFGGSTIITLIPKGLLALDGDVHFLSNKCVAPYPLFSCCVKVFLLVENVSCIVC